MLISKYPCVVLYNNQKYLPFLNKLVYYSVNRYSPNICYVPDTDLRAKDSKII